LDFIDDYGFLSLPYYLLFRLFAKKPGFLAVPIKTSLPEEGLHTMRPDSEIDYGRLTGLPCPKQEKRPCFREFE